MGALRDRMREDLELGGYAVQTQRVHLSAAAELAQHYWRSPAALDREEVRAYVRHLVQSRDLSASRIRQHLAALKFLYEKTLGRPDAVSFVTWPLGAEPSTDSAQSAGNRTDSRGDRGSGLSSPAGDCVCHRSAPERGQPAARSGHRRRMRHDPRSPREERQGAAGPPVRCSSPAPA